MKKKALIIATTLLLVIAIAVGVTFAAWNVSSKSKDFNVTVGKNIDLRVTFNAYNTSLENDNPYSGTDETAAKFCDDMILIPNGAILETNVNNAYNVLFGTFKITENGGWDADTLKATYTVKSKTFGDLDLSKAENASYDVFDIMVMAASDVDVNADYVSKSIPKAGAGSLVANDSALDLNGVYYVFVSFKSDFNGNASDFMGKSLKINLEINAAAIVAA